MDIVHGAAGAAHDRRVHQRARYRGRLWLSGLRNTHWARIRDVSPGGVGIDVDAVQLRPGTRLQVGFDLPRGGRVVAEAMVMRRVGEQAGLRFVALDAASANALDQFVLQQAS